MNLASKNRLKTLGAGYSAFVRVAKVALPLAALVILGVVIARLNDTALPQQIAALPKEDKTAPGQISLVAAKYEGVGDEGQAYTLTADSAARGSEGSLVLLEKPRGDIALKSGGWLAVHADRGTYDMDRQTLALDGSVRIFHDSGYELATEKLDTTVKTKAAVAETPVQGHGPAGDIAGRNMTVSENGDLVVFGGPATMTLHLKKPPKG